MPGIQEFVDLFTWKDVAIAIVTVAIIVFIREKPKIVKR